MNRQEELLPDPDSPPASQMTTVTIDYCGRCGIAIPEDQYERCWRCGGHLCFACWENDGECGHSPIHTAGSSVTT